MILIFIAVNEQVTFYEAVIRIHLWPQYIMASHLCFHFICLSYDKCLVRSNVISNFAEYPLKEVKLKFEQE